MPRTEESTYPEAAAIGLGKAEIEIVVDAIVGTYSLGVGFDIVALVSKLGGTVGRVAAWDRLQQEGSIAVHPDKSFDIRLLDDAGLRRQRFTIAHELGHFVLHSIIGGQGALKAWRYGSGPAERECNVFAGSLLMPRNQFINIHEMHGGRRGLLADSFGVSTWALEIRAEELGLSLC